MDRDHLRSVLRTTSFDLWTLIDTAISAAASDHAPELRLRRDGIVERLYAPPQPSPPLQDPCQRESDDQKQQLRSREREEEKGSSSPIDKVFGSSPLTPQSNPREELGDDDVDIEDDDDDEEEDDDRRSFGRPIDQEQRKILAIKGALDDPDQLGDSIAELLQSLADMDITFKALQETDIGRHVNRLRKHKSAAVQRLAKQLVKKWKDIVDEWVKASENSSPAAFIQHEESPQQIAAKSIQNGHRVPDFGYSPNPHNGRMGSNRSSNMEEASVEAKPRPVPRWEAPLKPIHSTNPAKLKEDMESLADAERLANARKRLQENYQEAQNAKKQRTIQVMGIHELPKPKKFVRGAKQRRAPASQALVTADSRQMSLKFGPTV